MTNEITTSYGPKGTGSLRYVYRGATITPYYPAGGYGVDLNGKWLGNATTKSVAAKLIDTEIDGVPVVLEEAA